jgi:putative endonuclease
MSINSNWFPVSLKHTQTYNVDRLVYFETFEEASAAIRREKQLKSGSRAKKVALINALNPEWRDLYADVCT